MGNKYIKSIEGMEYLVRAKAKDEPEDYIILPEKPKVKKYVIANGKRYEDITAEFIDCGA